MHLLRPGELVSAPETAGGRVGGSVSKSVCMAGFSKIAGNSDKSAAWCALPPDVHSQATGCSELPLEDAKTGVSPCPGRSMEDAYLLFMRCPVYWRHDSHSGFRGELENLGGDAKGKGASGRPTRPKVLKHRQGCTAS